MWESLTEGLIVNNNSLPYDPNILILTIEYSILIENLTPCTRGLGIVRYCQAQLQLQLQPKPELRIALILF